MNSVSIVVIAVAVSLGAAAARPAAAQPDPSSGQPPQDEGRGGDAGGRRDLRDMTLQQFQARQVSNLMQADGDHDGRISLAEWTAWREAHPGRGGREGGRGDPAQSFARFDLNHDGYITADEISAAAATRYARMQGGAPGMGPDSTSPASAPPTPQ